MTIGETYTLDTITSTSTGQCLYKGGKVKLLHIFKAGIPPVATAITEYYGFSPDSKAFASVNNAFKEDRIVLERENGKRVILLSRYSKHISGGDAAAPVTGIGYTDPEKVKRDVAVNQIWTFTGTVVGQLVKFRVEWLSREENRIMLAYHNLTSEGVEQWVEGHKIPLNGFSVSMSSNNAVLLTI